MMEMTAYKASRVRFHKVRKAQRARREFLVVFKDIRVMSDLKATLVILEPRAMTVKMEYKGSKAIPAMLGRRVFRATLEQTEYKVLKVMLGQMVFRAGRVSKETSELEFKVHRVSRVHKVSARRGSKVQ